MERRSQSFQPAGGVTDVTGHERQTKALFRDHSEGDEGVGT